MYLDDIIVFSQTVEEHLQRLEEVLERLQQAGLKIKPSKCHILCKSVKYLGYIVSEKGVEVDAGKISCVSNWAIPLNQESLRHFLGFTSYYRRFIPNFAQIAAPLHTLTEKSREWLWTKQCEDARPVELIIKSNISYKECTYIPKYKTLRMRTNTLHYSPSQKRQAPMCHKCSVPVFEVLYEVELFFWG